MDLEAAINSVTKGREGVFFGQIFLTSQAPILNVSYFQSEFMKSSFLPNYKQKIIKISAPCSEGRNPDNFLFVFW